MSVDEFLVWAESQPGRHELVHGRVIAMAPERLRHTRAKFTATLALRSAVGKVGAPCEVWPDGVTVRVDASTAFEPDVLVRCGPPLDETGIEVPDPLIVVEVLSPSTRNYDAGAKLTGYFRISSLQHYLIIDADQRVIVHHQRLDGGMIAARIVGFGPISLDPPGIEVSVEDMLPPP